MSAPFEISVRAIWGAFKRFARATTQSPKGYQMAELLAPAIMQIYHQQMVTIPEAVRLAFERLPEKYHLTDDERVDFDRRTAEKFDRQAYLIR